MTTHPPSGLPPVVQPAPTANQASQRSPEKNPLLHNRALIMGLLFGVTGALGLPLLWYSPVFTRQEKWFWSLINIAYTALLIAIALAAIWFAVSALSQNA